MTINDYADVDATEIAQRVRTKQVTARECVDAAIAAIERVNPKLNAVVHRMFEKARAHADQLVVDESAQSKPFVGVPFVFKDLDGFLGGEPYAQGSRSSQGFVPDHDAEIVARMKRTGVIAVAKTACPEFGIMGTTEPEVNGPTRNPWNVDVITGGSSGGTAALVAARCVPFGHGGDGGGSIRIPSSACGLFGLKPTRGRNPLGPDVGEAWGGYVQQGVLTRSVRDCAAMLDATCGYAPGEPYTAPSRARPFLEETKAKPKKLRIAFSTKSQLGRDVHPDCVAAVRDAAKLCEELGHDVVEAEPHVDKAALVDAYFTQVAVGVASGIAMTEQWTRRKIGAGDVEPSTWLLAQIGRKLGALDLQRSRDACQTAGFVVARFFAQHDVFLNATLSYPPSKVGELALKPAERAALAALRVVSPRPVLDRVLADLGANALEKTPNTQVANMTGVPAMSVPLFWNAAGVPIGAHFTAPFGDEATLLRLAAQLEAARPWAAKKPPVSA